MESKNNFNITVNIVKTLLAAITFLFQLFLLSYSIFKFSETSNVIYWTFKIIATLLVLKIIYNDNKATYKVTWIVFLLLFPTSGILFYLLFGRARFLNKTINDITEIEKDNTDYYTQNEDVLKTLQSKTFTSYANLLFNEGKYPIFKNTKVEYLPLGEDFFKKLIEQLKTAEKFIFMEYFIVSDGKMHREIMEVLKERANAGVEVKYLYDHAGSISVVPYDFKKECEENNIELVPFNPLSRKFYSFVNYRDHKKITVIDGYKGFTGGINIGDEYINEVNRFGHWKDMAMYLEGEAVYALSSFFLWSWNLETKQRLKFIDYKPTSSYINNNTYVIPFQDCAINMIDIAEENYIKLINNAKQYVYITTPYLIIGENVASALKLAAKSGVDVRILTPHIPDKKVVFSLTRSFYAELINAGVKIYEYTPGFVHGKILVADGTTSLVGTINFDYRSLLWNYECACLVYDTEFAKSVTEDYLKTLEVSHLADESIWKDINSVQHFARSLLKLIAPLL